MKDNKKKTVTVGVQELSPTEIKRRESEYWKDVREFGRGLIAGERFKKDGIIKLAKDLEQAGTVETHKISVRIKSDLKDIIDKQLLSMNFVAMVLEAKYKQQTRPTKKPDKENNNVFSEQNQSTETTFGSTGFSTTTTTTEGQEQLSEKVKDIQKHDTLAQELLGYLKILTEKITGYDENQILNFGRDYRGLTSATKEYRFELTKRLSDLNLKTVYDLSRMLSSVLDNFVEQLDDELGSRKNKEALTSE